MAREATSRMASEARPPTTGLMTYSQFKNSSSRRNSREGVQTDQGGEKEGEYEQVKKSLLSRIIVCESFSILAYLCGILLAYCCVGVLL